MRRRKPYFVLVRDSEGNESEYLFEAPSRRRASADARAWVAETKWNPTLVAVSPAVEGPSIGYRLLRVALVTFVLSSATIATTMFVGLKLQGAV